MPHIVKRGRRAAGSTGRLPAAGLALRAVGAASRPSSVPRRLGLALAALTLVTTVASPAAGQGASPVTETARANRANWVLADRYSTTALRNVVYSTSVQPRFIGQTDSLWYNWRSSDGSRFYLVLPQSRTKQPLFDHVKLAAALAAAHRRAYEPNNLPFTTLNFTKDHRKLRFQVDSIRYEWDLRAETLRSLGRWRRDSIPDDEERATGGGGSGGGGGGGGGFGGGQQADFRNFSPDSTAFVFAREHELFLVDVAQGDTVRISRDGERNYSFGFRDTAQVQQQQQQQQDDDLDEGERQERQARSRDPRVRANVTWSPDSRAFFVTRNDSRKVKELYLVNVLADPRPTLRSYTYAMPGEENVARMELNVFRRGDSLVTPVNVRRWKDQRLLHIHWTTGSETLRLVRRARTQRDLELIEVDLGTRRVRTLLTESVESAFLETQPVRYVKPGGDMVWWSERSGWGHYYLYTHDGVYKRPLTEGSWRAEQVVALDSIRGILWIAGVGREAGENPYFRHLYRVNGDGSGFTLLDPGHFTHVSTVSPTRRFIVANYSRVDSPTRSVVREALTGRVVMELEEADVSKLVEMGWSMPERFTTKAADGVTDIYGVMWKPFDFDSTRSYPLIAHVYPGPQTETVTHTFSPNPVPQQLAQLGFIVIQIGNRGGSPQRSNAYHSFGYYNLRDYALADKKTGIEQLAARHRFIDIERVGIYGHSGGGFLTAAALLQPPYNDFFKVGVSSAGNHDNNIYNQNWSEQHHGLKTIVQRRDSAAAGRTRASAERGTNPGGGEQGASEDADGAAIATVGTTVTIADERVLGAWYDPDTVDVDADLRYEIKVPTNSELAANLKGRLLLVHGDMDNNVHPGNTIRLVDALIKANKRFDFMIMPGQAHGFGRMQPYFTRMTFEYFTEHLMGDYYRAGADMP
ncbi:MAG TPA: DPP IV N-terminal domain-containing protein [Gemmatimonadaceae bacterium]|nr:DPP IV N-terminal domain-containing protein [Gemmatimonadaceae bacterium]